MSKTEQNLHPWIPWQSSKDASGQRKRGICTSRHSYLKWPASPHALPALQEGREACAHARHLQEFISSACWRTAHQVICLTLGSANDPESMQKCKCNFCIQPRAFWWEAGIAKLWGKHIMEWGFVPFLCSTMKDTEVIKVHMISSLHSPTILFTPSILIPPSVAELATGLQFPKSSPCAWTARQSCLHFCIEFGSIPQLKWG